MRSLISLPLGYLVAVSAYHALSSLLLEGAVRPASAADELALPSELLSVTTAATLGGLTAGIAWRRRALEVSVLLGSALVALFCVRLVGTASFGTASAVFLGLGMLAGSILGGLSARRVNRAWVSEGDSKLSVNERFEA